jgi:hypothetical protein
VTSLYRWPEINNDIALVRVANTIEFVPGAIEPVWLPYPDQEFFCKLYI